MRVRALVVGTMLLASCASCASGSGDDGLLVFAAASLTESFREIGEAFADRDGGGEVTFNFGPSDGLATQIVSEGAADVFASASPRWMDAVEAGPGVENRADFARNRLAVIVPAGNPAGIGAIEDLARDGVRLVLAAVSVPVGGYAREALANAGIAEEAEGNVVSNEEDVKGVVQKVVLDEADAGIVYVTDVTPEVSDRVEIVDIPDAMNVIARYSIAVVAGTDSGHHAGGFVDFVMDEGQSILARYGFLPPA